MIEELGYQEPCSDCKAYGLKKHELTRFDYTYSNSGSLIASSNHITGHPVCTQKPASTWVNERQNHHCCCVHRRMRRRGGGGGGGRGAAALPNSGKTVGEIRAKQEEKIGLVWFGFRGLTPQQQPGSYQGGEMMMKSVFWWRKPEHPEGTTDLRQVTDETLEKIGQRKLKD